jgi:hypothetical protein
MTTAQDGYSNVTTRDTTGCSGGTPGHVNTTTMTHCIAGRDVRAFEWAHLCLLDNHSEAGENVALYAQANKHSSGPTWGACIEACDTTPGDSTGLVGAEVDCWVSGPDNGLRYGIDVVLGDSCIHRGLPKSELVEGTAGIRVGASNVAPHAKWSRGIELTGRMDVGIDLSNCQTTAPIKLPGGIVLGKRDPLVYVAIVLSVLSIGVSLFT